MERVGADGGDARWCGKPRHARITPKDCALVIPPPSHTGLGFPVSLLTMHASQVRSSHQFEVGKAPRLPFSQVDRLASLSSFTPAASRDAYLLNPSEDLVSISTVRYRITIWQLLQSLHELSTFLNLLPSRTLPWDAAYPDRVYEVEYRILVSLFGDEVLADSDDKIRIANILLSSGLLFIYSNLRETPVGAAYPEASASPPQSCPR